MQSTSPPAVRALALFLIGELAQQIVVSTGSWLLTNGVWSTHAAHREVTRGRVRGADQAAQPLGRQVSLAAFPERMKHRASLPGQELGFLCRHYLETEHLEYLQPEVQRIADRIMGNA
jgi:hypothetical protein